MGSPYLSLSQHGDITTVSQSYVDTTTTVLQSEVISMTKVAEWCQQHHHYLSKMCEHITPTTAELCNFTSTTADLRGYPQPPSQMYTYDKNHCRYLNMVPPIRELLTTATSIVVMWTQPPPSQRNGNTVDTVIVMWIPPATQQWYLSTMMPAITELSECRIQSHSCVLQRLKLQSYANTRSTNIAELHEYHDDHHRVLWITFLAVHQYTYPHTTIAVM